WAIRSAPPPLWREGATSIPHGASALPRVFLSCQKGDQVHELVRGQPFLQAFGHGARGLRPLLLDILLRQLVLSAFIVAQRDGVCLFVDPDAGEHPSILEE